MSTQHQAPEVTSEDRKAAWPYADFHCLPDYQMRERWFAGYYDTLSEGAAIRSFAEHRARATQPLSLTVDWPADAEFQLGDLVQKKGRASWRGHVRGWYRTELTELGYAVESMYEPGSVQIYPASALDRLQSLSLPVDIDRSGLAQEVES